MSTFAWWESAEGGFSDAEVVRPDTYAIRCVASDVGNNDRIWTLWEITAGPDAGTSFFGPSFGLQAKDAAKEKKVQGMFKAAMQGFGIPDTYAKAASGLADFAKAIVGVEGTAEVRIRVWKGKDGREQQGNDFKKFNLTTRPDLPIDGGAVVPDASAAPIAASLPTAAPGLPNAQAAPPIVREQAPVVDEVVELRAKLAAAEAAASIPGTPDGPPVTATPLPVASVITTVEEPTF